MTHIFVIKKNIWNIININECERRSEIDNTSVNTTFGTTINKNYKRDGRCVKSEKDYRFTSHIG